MIPVEIGRKARRILALVFGVLALTSLSYYTGYHEKILNSINIPASLSMHGSEPEAYQRENGTFITLCREKELGSALEAVSSWEDRLNGKYHYDWVFLNDKPFTEFFKTSIKNLVSGKALFGVLPPDMWEIPDFIDDDLLKQGLKNMKDDKVMYSDSIPYRQMCRFYSGKFYDHELLQNYKYFWRVDPDTEMFCDIEYDVFKKMREEDIQYGFVIAFKEAMQTIPSLWQTVRDFFKEYPDYLHPNSAQLFVTDETMAEYNSCHFWTNFEVGDMDFFRSEEYRAYFDYLDKTGNFFYERWGDAPVHSIAVAMMMDREKIHYFDDIGYIHTGVTHVPEDYIGRGLKCSRTTDKNFDWRRHSCLREANVALSLQYSPPPVTEKDADMMKKDKEKLAIWRKEWEARNKAQKEKWQKAKGFKGQDKNDQDKNDQDKKGQGQTDQAKKDQEKKDQEKKVQEKKDQEKKDQEKKDQEKKDQEKKEQEKKDQAKKDQANKDQANKDQTSKDLATKS